jgi:hypothetical protein
MFEGSSDSTEFRSSEKHMKNAMSIASVVASSMLMVSAGVDAKDCDGVFARQYEKPIPVHKGADGSQTYHVRSTGASIRRTAEGTPLNSTWQHCTGLWTVNADKSGSGSGNCYSVDEDGDRWVIAWAGDNAGGTWEGVLGTGKHANNVSDNGTWRRDKKFANGMRTGIWEGECAD